MSASKKYSILVKLFSHDIGTPEQAQRTPATHTVSIPCDGLWKIRTLVAKVELTCSEALGWEIKILKALDGDLGTIERDSLVEEHFYTKLDAKGNKDLYTLNLIHEPLSEEMRARLAREGTLTLGGTADFRDLGDGAKLELQNEERIRRENANKRKRDSSLGMQTGIPSIEDEASVPQEIHYTTLKRQRIDGVGGRSPLQTRQSSVQLTHTHPSQGAPWVVPKTEEPEIEVPSSIDSHEFRSSRAMSPPNEQAEALRASTVDAPTEQQPRAASPTEIVYDSQPQLKVVDQASSAEQRQRDPLDPQSLPDDMPKRQIKPTRLGQGRTGGAARAKRSAGIASKISPPSPVTSGEEQRPTTPTDNSSESEPAELAGSVRRHTARAKADNTAEDVQVHVPSSASKKAATYGRPNRPHDQHAASLQKFAEATADQAADEEMMDTQSTDSMLPPRASEKFQSQTQKHNKKLSTPLGLARMVKANSPTKSILKASAQQQSVPDSATLLANDEGAYKSPSRAVRFAEKDSGASVDQQPATDSDLRAGGKDSSEISESGTKRKREPKPPKPQKSKTPYKYKTYYDALRSTVFSRPSPTLPESDSQTVSGGKENKKTNSSASDTPTRTSQRAKKVKEIKKDSNEAQQRSPKNRSPTAKIVSGKVSVERSASPSKRPQSPAAPPPQPLAPDVSDTSGDSSSSKTTTTEPSLEERPGSSHRVTDENPSEPPRRPESQSRSPARVVSQDDSESTAVDESISEDESDESDESEESLADETSEPKVPPTEKDGYQAEAEVEAEAGVDQPPVALAVQDPVVHEVPSGSEKDDSWVDPHAYGNFQFGQMTGEPMVCVEESSSEDEVPENPSQKTPLYGSSVNRNNTRLATRPSLSGSQLPNPIDWSARLRNPVNQREMEKKEALLMGKPEQINSTPRGPRHGVSVFRDSIQPVKALSASRPQQPGPASRNSRLGSSVIRSSEQSATSPLTGRLRQIIPGFSIDGSSESSDGQAEDQIDYHSPRPSVPKPGQDRTSQDRVNTQLQSETESSLLNMTQDTAMQSSQAVAIDTPTPAAIGRGRATANRSTMARTALKPSIAKGSVVSPAAGSSQRGKSFTNMMNKQQLKATQSSSPHGTGTRALFAKSVKPHLIDDETTSDDGEADDDEEEDGEKEEDGTGNSSSDGSSGDSHEDDSSVDARNQTKSKSRGKNSEKWKTLFGFSTRST